MEWPKDAGQCNCQAQEHKLLNNCLTCGRILCVVYKGEACPFCGHDLEETLEMSSLIQRLNDKSSIYGGGSFVEAKVLAEKLVEADEGGNRDVIDEAAEGTLYAKWETIKETRHRMERIQQKAEKEREERTRRNLSSLLGFE